MTTEANTNPPDEQAYKFLMNFTQGDRRVLYKEADDLGISMSRVIRRALHLYFRVPVEVRHSMEYSHPDL